MLPQQVVSGFDYLTAATRLSMSFFRIQYFGTQTHLPGCKPPSLTTVCTDSSYHSQWLHFQSRGGALATSYPYVQSPIQTLSCSVLALHNLIDNQEQRVWQEKLGRKRPELKNGKAS